jgi:NitT/TauT family transport system ATP-binding protein
MSESAAAAKLAKMRIAVAEKVYPAVGGHPARRVLADIDLVIEPRSFVVLTGPSGCGKSTLLNIVAGLDRDYAGSVDIGPAGERVAFVFQAPRLLPWRTVEQNVALALPEGDPRSRNVGELLEGMGLGGHRNAYPERISLGMQRRVALARAFVLEPELLLMDEPFVSLDEATAQGLRQLLIVMTERRPTTVLFVTHDRMEAVQLGTRILRMSGTNATIVQDSEVRLTRTDRTNRAAVAAEHNRIFGST